MDFKEFPNEFSLRHHVHVLCVYTDAILKFAEEIAEDAPDHLTEDDKIIYDVIADYLDRASYNADKLQKRVRRT